MENIILEKLFGVADSKYREFHSRLLPTIDKNTIIGVRIPVLRKFATEIYNTSMTKDFLQDLPHKYYDENNLHAFLIEKITDYNLAIMEIDKFLPFVDNWATCDLMCPKVLKKHLPDLILKIKVWICSNNVFAVRFGVRMLMNSFLDENFTLEYPELVTTIKSDEYYVKMMVAWYFATALAKHYESVLPFIEQHKLDAWIHNKTIQKAIESYRLTDEHKAYLKTLKFPVTLFERVR